MKEITSAMPFRKGVDGGYNGGHVGGAAAIPHALSKVCCTRFPSELYYVFIEMLIFRGTVVVAAVCKIIQKQQVNKRKVD